MGRTRASDKRDERDRGEPIRRREVWLLAGVLLTGTALRIAAARHSAVEHFDEGVYASNVFFPPPEYAFPMQQFFAPPLVPGVIEVCLTAGILVGLPANVAALLPGILAGCVSIAAVWWLGRSWLSPQAGIAAAALAAGSPFHIAHSATALTDVLLGLWLAMAVDAAARSLVKHDLRWAVAAGLYTGLAWWTKYNGWLPLAIEGAGLVVLAALGLRRVPAVGNLRFPRLLGCFAVTTLVAVLVISPYLLMLQSQGGYGPIAANHAKYVVGLGGWLDSAGRHIASFALMDRGWTAVALVAALVLAAFTKMGTGETATRSAPPWFGWPLFAVALGVVASWFAGGLLSLAVLSAAGLLMMLTRLVHESPSRMNSATAAVGLSLLAAWWGGMLVATPCYWPYPRLLVPWLAVAWLGTAAFVAELTEWFFAAPGAKPTAPAARRLMNALCGVSGFAMLAAIGLAQFCRPAAELQTSLARNRLAIKHAATYMRADLDSWRAPDESPGSAAAPRVVYVLGEPALFFQLSAAGESLVRPVQEIVTTPAALHGRPLPTFLAIGPHAERDPAFTMSWAAAEKQLSLVAVYRFKPSPIVWLDSHDPRRRLNAALQTESEIRLYQIRPGATGSFNP